MATATTTRSTVRTASVKKAAGSIVPATAAPIVNTTAQVVEDEAQQQPKAQPTVAELQQQIAQLQLQLEQRDEFCQILWLNDRRTIGTTKNGKPFVRFTAQKSTKLTNGSRAYGAYKNLVAYGEMADEVGAIFDNQERLVRISGFESPWLDNSKRSDFVVTAIEIIAPLEGAPARQPAAYGAEGPTDEEIPF